METQPQDEIEQLSSSPCPPLEERVQFGIEERTGKGNIDLHDGLTEEVSKALDTAYLPKITKRGLREGLKTATKWSRIKKLLPIVLFKVILIFADVLSDSVTALTFFLRGHVWWGVTTLALQFLPMTVSLAFNLLYRIRGYKVLFSRTVQLIPYVQPIRNCIAFLRLVILDTDDSRNFAVVERVQKKISTLALFEAFLEAGPQFVFQLSLVLRLGYISIIQSASMVISFFSLSYAAYRAYFLMRTDNYSDPDPDLGCYVVLILPLFVFLTGAFVCSWAVLLSYLRGWAILLWAAVVLANSLVLVSEVRIHRLLHAWRGAGRIHTMGMRQRGGREYMTDFRMLGSFATTQVPCIIGHYKEHMLFPLQLTTTLCLLLLLGFVPQMTDVFGLERSDNPPILHCFKTRNKTMAGQVCPLEPPESLEPNCKENLITVCFTECVPMVRYCSTNEEPFDVFLNVVFLSLEILLGISLFIGLFLQWMGNYKTFYRFTNVISCGRGFIHRSLIFTLLKTKDYKTSEEVLPKVKRTCNRPNHEGNSPLHFAVEMHDSKNCELLVQAGYSATAVRNTDGESAVELAMRLEYFDVVDILLKDTNTQKYVNDGLWFSARNGNLDRIELFLRAGAKVDYKRPDYYGSTPLSMASAYGHSEAVGFLLEHGADVDLADDNGLTPLMDSAGWGKCDCVVELLAHGANPNAADRIDGWTALHRAVRFGHPRVVALLAETGGVDLDPRDNSGRTPLDLAEETRNSKAGDYLRSKRRANTT